MTFPRFFQRGFTLVEILIVVIILGILAAIVVPQFANANARTKQDPRGLSFESTPPAQMPAGVR